MHPPAQRCALTSLAAGAAFALFITTCFLCAAAFISVLEKYGPVQACLAGAGVFLSADPGGRGELLGVQAAAAASKLNIAAERAAKSAAQSMLADPMLLATGLQIVRAIGIKRLLPILAIGGVAPRHHRRAAPAHPTRPRPNQPNSSKSELENFVVSPPRASIGIRPRGAQHLSLRSDVLRHHANATRISRRLPLKASP